MKLALNPTTGKAESGIVCIESNQSLGRHPKLLRLANRLRVHKAQAIGHLQYLWWWALDYAPNGNVSAFTSAEISAAAEYPGDPAPFLDALKDGWLDERGALQEWPKCCLREPLENTHIYIGSKETEESLKTLKPKDKSTSLEDKKHVERRKKPPFVQPTAAQVTEYAKSIGFSLDGSQFVDFYQANGWRAGRNPMRDWQASVRTWKRNHETGMFEKGGKNVGNTKVGKYDHLGN